MNLSEEKVRAYLYRISLAVIPLLVVYGALDENDAGGWATLAAAVLGVPLSGLATRYTSTRPPAVKDVDVDNSP